MIYLAFHIIYGQLFILLAGPTNRTVNAFKFCPGQNSYDHQIENSRKVSFFFHKILSFHIDLRTSMVCHIQAIIMHITKCNLGYSQLSIAELFSYGALVCPLNVTRPKSGANALKRASPLLNGCPWGFLLLSDKATKNAGALNVCNLDAFPL